MEYFKVSWGIYNDGFGPDAIVSSAPPRCLDFAEKSESFVDERRARIFENELKVAAKLLRCERSLRVTVTREQLRE
jgi:hypothetical protein